MLNLEPDSDCTPEFLAEVSRQFRAKRTNMIIAMVLVAVFAVVMGPRSATGLWLGFTRAQRYAVAYPGFLVLIAYSFRTWRCPVCKHRFYNRLFWTGTCNNCHVPLR